MTAGPELEGLLRVAAGAGLRVTGLETDEVLDPSYTAGAPGLYSVCRIPSSLFLVVLHSSMIDSHVTYY